MARAVLLIAAVLAVLSLWNLEKARHGVDLSASSVGQTPVTRYAQPDAEDRKSVV